MASSSAEPAPIVAEQGHRQDDGAAPRLRQRSERGPRPPRGVPLCGCIAARLTTGLAEGLAEGLAQPRCAAARVGLAVQRVLGAAQAALQVLGQSQVTFYVNSLTS